MYRDALSRAMSQKDQRVLGGAATRRRAGARAAFPSHAETTSRARARRGNASKRGILVSDDAWPRAIQTGLGLRGKAAQWRVDAPEMGNGETPRMYRKADGLLNRAIGAFERQAGSSGSLWHWRAFGGPKQKSSRGTKTVRKESAVAPWH